MFLSKISVKSTPELALVEVHSLRAVGLAGLQPDVRRDLENIVNDSLHNPKQNLFAIKSTPVLVLVEALHLGVASQAGLQPDVWRDLEKVTNDSLTLSNECQNFPGNKIPVQKISRWNVPGQENSGTRKFQEFHFFPEFEKYFFEKIPGFFPAGAENSRTFNPT